MPVFLQIIFKGETDRVVPGEEVLDNMLLDHSVSRWETVAIVLRLVGFMQVLGHAPIQRAKTSKFQTKVKEASRSGCTSVVQPCDDSNLTQVLEEADELEFIGQLFLGQGLEQAEEDQPELGDVQPELCDVEEERLKSQEPESEEEVCAAAEDKVEDVSEGEEAEEDACTADLQAKSKDTRTLSRLVALPLVYGSARRSDFTVAASFSTLSKYEIRALKMAWLSGLRG
eukprot:5184704-Amphidinium_carterae.2